MEFERALFRIHHRTLSSEGVRKVRLQVERCLPWAIAALFGCLAVLHTDYIGQARCLPDALKKAGLWNETSDQASLPDDMLLSLSVTEGFELLDTGIRLRMQPPQPPLPTSQPPKERRQGGASVGPGFSVAAENASSLIASSAGAGWAELSPDPSSVLIRYRFAFDREVIMLRPSTLKSHNFEVRNITVSERCLAPSLVLSEAFRLMDALDGIVINELAYTFRSKGFLVRMDGTTEVESWAWSEHQVEAASPRNGRSLLAALIRKAQLLLKALITFLLISAISGFFIRVAVNGSAVLMFPIALAAQALGGPNSGRISPAVLTRSFPWIGVHVEVLRRAGRPVWPLFRSHLAFLFFQSFAYLSCNLAWRFVLYRKSSPEGFEERVFSFCSILELFNLIFVRSVSSGAVFPKLTTAIMVYLHFYIFCSLYPFHTLALTACVASCAYVMVYCLNHFEEPALRADPFAHTTPTAAHPRALYMPQLSPSWTLESAPLWTMFYPPEPPSAFPEEAMRHISNEEYLMA
mmetsp:Transcript_40106/g.105734  ORF Transcript_40106/g.105734 Transcript_40106/m.105734 type:complete len:521 (+) Transcript_40106:73-1635(+)